MACVAGFEWDDGKAESNLRKHGVSFEEAAEVFRDALAVTVVDALHEDRLLIVGMTTRSRLLIVVHVEVSEEVIRIISAREATTHERKTYEEGT